MVKASAAAAVITHLGKRRDFILMATASISYVFQMRLWKRHPVAGDVVIACDLVFDAAFQHHGGDDELRIR
jgi:hypothetical protein